MREVADSGSGSRLVVSWQWAPLDAAVSRDVQFENCLGTAHATKDTSGCACEGVALSCDGPLVPQLSQPLSFRFT